jgi:ArsR family transcriptional regulator, arsenate/arsenite/antimonite-responsive transcriptional repressor
MSLDGWRLCSKASPARSGDFPRARRAQAAQALLLSMASARCDANPILTPVHCFYIRGNMEKIGVIEALSALAQHNRLDTYRLLVEAGPDGMPAGEVATALGLAPNTLSFHFDRLRHAGLVTVRREGRCMIYAASYDTMNALLAYLTENCCRDARARRATSGCAPTPTASQRKKENVP